MRRFLIAAAAIGLVLATPAARVFAHAQLESSSPANGQALATSPTELVFDFNETVSLDLGGVSLTDATGKSIDLGESTLRRPDVVVVTDVPSLPDGQYVAGYRVVSADGHPVSGNIVFRVGAGAVDTSVSIEDAASSSVEAVYGVARFAAYPPLAIAVGIPLVGLLVWPPARRRASRAWSGAAALLAAATVVQFVVAVPYLSGQSWSSAWSPDQWWTLAGTTTGGWLLIRVAASAALWATLAVSSRRAADPPNTLTLIAAAVLIASFVGEGHSAAAGWFSIDAASTFVHIAAMSLWLAGLGTIVWGIRHDERDLLAASARRWTPSAMTAVAVLAVTGVIQALAVRPDRGSFSSRYLTVLFVKVGLVVLMIGLGALGRRALRRRIDDGSWPASLRTTVSLEVLLAVVILAATTVLSQTAPTAASAVSPAPGVHLHPQTSKIQLGDRSMSVVVDDMSIGRRSIEVTVDDAVRPFVDPVTLQGRLTLPEQGLGPIPIVFDGTGERQWNAEVEIPSAGTWDLELFVVDSQTKARFSTTIDFHPEGAHHDS